MHALVRPKPGRRWLRLETDLRSMHLIALPQFDRSEFGACCAVDIPTFGLAPSRQFFNVYLYALWLKTLSAQAIQCHESCGFPFVIRLLEFHPVSCYLT